MSFLLGISGSAVVGEESLFEVRFSDREVSFAGAIASEESGQTLANAVRSVRPDLAIVNKGLRIAPEEPLPDAKELESVLVELGLSTHEGRLEISPESLLVGGITDSIVTITALRIRIEPLLENRHFINRVCVVNSEDLPDIKVSLSTVSNDAQLLDFEYHPSAEEVFQAPGIPVEKWFPTLVMLSDFDRLEGKKPSPLVAQPLEGQPLEGQPLEGQPLEGQPLEGQPLVAMPVGESVLSDPAAVFEALDEVDATPQPTFQTLGSIFFSRSSFLLQANQQPAVEEISKALMTPGLKGLPVILRPLKASGGSGAFNEYMCEKRAEEVKKLLNGAGVSQNRFSTEVTGIPSPIDGGEVRVVVKIPPPPPPEEEAENEETEGSGETKVTVGTPPATPVNEGSDTGSEEAATDTSPVAPLKPFRLKAEESE